MPYGIAKAVGGDTPETDAKMERCVQQVQAKGHDKLSAILICKHAVEEGLRKNQ